MAQKLGDYSFGFVNSTHTHTYRSYAANTSDNGGTGVA